MEGADPGSREEARLVPRAAGASGEVGGARKGAADRPALEGARLPTGAGVTGGDKRLVTSSATRVTIWSMRLAGIEPPAGVGDGRSRSANGGPGVSDTSAAFGAVCLARFGGCDCVARAEGRFA